jgi:hypothetical protein
VDLVFPFTNIVNIQQWISMAMNDFLLTDSGIGWKMKLDRSLCPEKNNAQQKSICE